MMHVPNRITSKLKLLPLLVFAFIAPLRLSIINHGDKKHGPLMKMETLVNPHGLSLDYTENCTLANKQIADAHAHDDIGGTSGTRSAQPVILISRGRSGSSVFWSTISELTGQRNRAFERTGSNQNETKIFFEETLQNNQSIGYDWAINGLCHIQQYRSDITPAAGIVGFQWKPFMNTFNHEYAIEGLRAVAAQKNPDVKIIYLTRNVLDRKASNLKHDASKRKHEDTSSGGGSIPHHCNIGDAECVKKHLEINSYDIVFPTGKELLHWLRSTVKDDRAIHKRLKEFQIQYVQVSYEKLFPSLHDHDNISNAEEWMRVFRFLNRGPMYGLTMEDVRASFIMAQTHTKSRNETIANYELVKETLLGTEFEHLLN